MLVFRPHELAWLHDVISTLPRNHPNRLATGEIVHVAMLLRFADPRCDSKARLYPKIGCSLAADHEGQHVGFKDEGGTAHWENCGAVTAPCTKRHPTAVDKVCSLTEGHKMEHKTAGGLQWSASAALCSVPRPGIAWDYCDRAQGHEGAHRTGSGFWRAACVHRHPEHVNAACVLPAAHDGRHHSAGGLTWLSPKLQREGCRCTPLRDKGEHAGFAGVDQNGDSLACPQHNTPWHNDGDDPPVSDKAVDMSPPDITPMPKATRELRDQIRAAFDDWFTKATTGDVPDGDMGEAASFKIELFRGSYDDNSDPQWQHTVETSRTRSQYRG